MKREKLDTGPALERQQGACADCGCDIRQEHVADPVTPFWQGGGCSEVDVRLLCPPCGNGRLQPQAEAVP